ncbi:MAG: quinone-dependent dihydroorotate dehydrogenase [Bacteroidales bacterium]
MRTTPGPGLMTIEMISSKTKNSMPANRFYRRFIRPLLFLFPPEFIHKVIAGALPWLFRIPGTTPLFRHFFLNNETALEREVFGLRFPNPVGVAAGFDKEANLYNSLANFGFGHVEVGTITPRGQRGNPRPRLFRLPEDQALINRMGFNNPGLDHFTARLRRTSPKVIIGGNIGKNTDTPNDKATEDYCHCFEQLYPLVDYFVVNISCPNIKDLDKLQDKPTLIALLHAIQTRNHAKEKKKPVLIKIAPDLTEKQLDEILEIVEETRLDGIVATNTTTGREGLSRKPGDIARFGQGGLSGRPLKDLSTKTIAYLHRKSAGRIPIIGVGGIMNPRDAKEKLRAGASLIQVYTGFIYYGPSIAKDINNTLLAE